jgi:hypothetical protein
MDADEQRAYNRSRLVQDAGPLMSRAAELLMLDADDQRLILSDLCLRVFNLGIRIGAAQVLAQLAEEGVDFQATMDPDLLAVDEDGPLSGA